VQMGKPGHHYLDGKGHALLGFHRRISRSRSIDLHLHVGNVWYRINRQPLVAIYTQCVSSRNNLRPLKGLFRGVQNQPLRQTRP
jgi:hypothetical protein